MPDGLGRLTMLEWMFLSVKHLEGGPLEVELEPSPFPKFNLFSAVFRADFLPRKPTMSIASLTQDLPQMTWVMSTVLAHSIAWR